MQTNANGPRKQIAVSPIEVTRIFTGDFQKEGTLSAELKQQITTKSFYPSKKVASSMQANIFDAKDDFGFDEQEFESTETRVAWINVPTSASIDEVKKRLAAKAGACLYKVLSNSPILTEEQEYSITQGLKTKDDFANSQAVRYPVGSEKEGQLVLDANGNVQYRKVFFMDKPQADVDNRGASEIYLSAELKAELEGASSVLASQRL